jgi:hypothetical protein
MKDLGSLHYFLGIHVQRIESGFFLHQAKYAKEVLDHAGTTNCKPSPTEKPSGPLLGLIVMSH